MVEDLKLIFTYESPHNLEVEVSRLLKTCLLNYLSLDEICSHPGRSAWKVKKVSFGEVSFNQSLQWYTGFY